MAKKFTDKISLQDLAYNLEEIPDIVTMDDAISEVFTGTGIKVTPNVLKQALQEIMDKGLCSKNGNISKILSGKSKKELCPTLPKEVIKVMCQAWAEMNAIRARDGVPLTEYGMPTVNQEYWDDIMYRLNKSVLDASGHEAWLHPYIYEQSVSDIKNDEWNSDPEFDR